MIRSVLVVVSNSHERGMRLGSPVIRLSLLNETADPPIPAGPCPTWIIPCCGGVDCWAVAIRLDELGTLRRWTFGIFGTHQLGAAKIQV